MLFSFSLSLVEIIGKGEALFEVFVVLEEKFA